MPTYTSPRTWSSELVEASDFNIELRDNQLAIKDPPSDNYEANEISDYSTSSTTLVDIDSTNLSKTITTSGGDILIGFTGTTYGNGGTGTIDILVDGTRLGDGTGEGLLAIKSGRNFVSTVRIATGLSSGNHTIKLQWRRLVAGTMVLYAGAGTTDYDVHPQFWVREIS